MKVNGHKTYLLLSRNKKAIVNIDNNCIESEDIHGLLGITIDSKLTLENYINKLCKKVSQNLNTLVKIFNYMAFNKRKIIMKAFIKSYFRYYPFVWMFHNKRLGEKMNALHERALRITYRGQNLLI